jgi:hypothetical protein
MRLRDIPRIEHYRIKIEKLPEVIRGKARVHRAHVCKIVNPDTEEERFDGRAKEGRLPKVYIVSYSSRIIYVGTTRQGISTRLWQGLTATGKGGYSGYAWKELALKNRGHASKWIDLFVYCLDPDARDQAAEALEAELVYLVRHRTGKWPEYQTEIHFRPPLKAELRIADYIYRYVVRKTKNRTFFKD